LKKRSNDHESWKVGRFSSCDAQRRKIRAAGGVGGKTLKKERKKKGVKINNGVRKSGSIFFFPKCQ